ncbi:MAG: ATP-binding protein [Phocaeicola sp.]
MLLRILALLVSLFLTHHSLFSAPQAIPQSRNQAPNKDTLLIKGDCDFPPYEFINEKGEPDGFAIELIHAIMKEAGIPYKIELDVYHKTLQDFREGTVDLLTTIEAINCRKGEFKFGPIHNHAIPNAVTHKNAPVVKSQKDLMGRKVIVLQEDACHHYLKELYGDQLILVDRLIDGFRLLNDYPDAVVLCGGEVARAIIFRYGFSDLQLSPIDLPLIDLCFAGKDEKLMARLSHAFATLKNNGTYEQIRHTWLEPLNESTVSKKIHLIIVALVLISALLYFAVILLKRKVKSEAKKVYSYLHRIEEILQFSEIIIWEYDLKTKLISFFTNANEPNSVITVDEYIALINPASHESTRKQFALMDVGMAPAFRIKQSSPEDKTPKHVIINGAPSYDSQKKVVKYTGMIRDITDLIEVQISLNKEKEKAQQSDKLKSAFLANMSHEIRTPLNAIIGFSDLLQYTESVEERQQFMEIINTNNELLLRLIDDILDLSKIESGVVEMNFETFNLNGLIENLACSLQPRIDAKKGLQLLLDIPTEINYVHLDYNRVMQLFTNFAVNAIKNTQQGTITMGYSCQEKGIRIFVEDTGIGIPQEEQYRIFQRFEKINDFVQGTGLGLSISKAIVEAFKGKIGFHSQKGEGSTFWAFIPCKVTQNELSKMEAAYE